MAATLQADTLKNASSATANITLDTAGNATVGGTLAMGSSFLRNRIINGDMRIDQRNAGASVTPTGGFTYSVDRFGLAVTAASKLSIQQSTTAPSGFTNSVKLTVASSFATGTTDDFSFRQMIEGLNMSDLAWGSASAKTVTLSFWTQSSVAGTYSISIRNGTADRSYVATYTISAANTWEYKTITITGDITGTWATNNTIGMYVTWDLGQGSNFNTSTVNAWQAGNYNRTSSSVSFVGQANGATFYITGVQLEVGSVATPFERRQYGQELALCQRYCQWVPFNMAGYQVASGNVIASVPYKVVMRITPAFAVLSADPNVISQSTINNATNSFLANYSGVDAGVAFCAPIASGTVQVLGYRSLATSEL